MNFLFQYHSKLTCNSRFFFKYILTREVEIRQKDHDIIFNKNSFSHFPTISQVLKKLTNLSNVHFYTVIEK